MMKKKQVITILVVLLLAGAYPAWQVFGPAVKAPESKYFFIKTGTPYAGVRQSLIDQQIIGNPFFFDILSKLLKYPKLVKAGRYQVKNGTSVFQLVRMLRAGNQSPVNLVINKLRVKEDLAQKIAANFECDSMSVMAVLTDTGILNKYQVNEHTILSVVIPNTYSLMWNSSPRKIIEKLYNEKEKFWNTERKAKAEAIKLTPLQVYCMASIVEEETNKEEDKGLIASVYLNRMHTGMKLQADPTVKFSLKDFGLKRIMFRHLGYDSPFNTYRYAGLPPGPICTPSPKTIDAVLNAPETNYFYFVAKPEFNGYSNFASTYAQHQVFAKAYQDALDSLIKAKANNVAK